MRYLCNTIKSIVNLAVDICFFIASMYFYFSNFNNHSRLDTILYIIVSVILTGCVDSMCDYVFSKKYGESINSSDYEASKEMVSKIMNYYNDKEKEEEKEE